MKYQSTEKRSKDKLLVNHNETHRRNGSHQEEKEKEAVHLTPLLPLIHSTTPTAAQTFLLASLLAT